MMQETTPAAHHRLPAARKAGAHEVRDGEGGASAVVVGGSRGACQKQEIRGTRRWGRERLAAVGSKAARWCGEGTLGGGRARARGGGGAKPRRRWGEEGPGQQS
jgi:hypothetical protein